MLAIESSGWTMYEWRERDAAPGSLSGMKILSIMASVVPPNCNQEVTSQFDQNTMRRHMDLS